MEYITPEQCETETPDYRYGYNDCVDKANEIINKLTAEAEQTATKIETLEKENKSLLAYVHLLKANDFSKREEFISVNLVKPDEFSKRERLIDVRAGDILSDELLDYWDEKLNVPPREEPADKLVLEFTQMLKNIAIEKGIDVPYYVKKYGCIICEIARLWKRDMENQN